LIAIRALKRVYPDTRTRRNQRWHWLKIRPLFPPVAKGLNGIFRRNLLDIAKRHGAHSPYRHNLHDALRRHSVSSCKFDKRPPADEVQLDKPPLNIRPRLLFEYWDLRRKTCPVAPNSQAKRLVGQFIYLHTHLPRYDST
jgi:hypothetical protein